MTKEWAQFWTAIAVMVVAGAAASLAATGLEVGSLADWFAGAASFAAVVTALRIADRQALTSNLIAEGARNEDALRRDRVDLIRAEALFMALTGGLNACGSVREAVFRTEDEKKAKAAQIYLTSSHFTMPDGLISKVDVNSIHDFELLELTVHCLNAWAISKQRIDLIASQENAINVLDELLKFEELIATTFNLSKRIRRIRYPDKAKVVHLADDAKVLAGLQKKISI